jgi:hypothetical protein
MSERFRGPRICGARHDRRPQCPLGQSRRWQS